MYTLKFKYQKADYLEEGHFIVGPMGVVRNMATSVSPNTDQIMPFTQFINAAIINNNSDSFIAEWLGKLELERRKQHIIKILKLIEPLSRVFPMIFRLLILEAILNRHVNWQC